MPCPWARLLDSNAKNKPAQRDRAAGTIWAVSDDGDPVLLALVLDDPRAPKVLAWWKANGPKLADADSLAPKIAEMVGSPESMVRVTLERCRTAGLLRDGGISTTAEKWLGSIVARSLGGRGNKGKR